MRDKEKRGGDRGATRKRGGGGGVGGCEMAAPVSARFVSERR